MKKMLLVGLLMPFALAAGAQEQNDSRIVENTIGHKIADVKEVLTSIEGYIFIEQSKLGVDKSRNIANTLNRRTEKEKDHLTEADLNNLLDWSVSNSSIASYDRATHTVTGHNYGETILTLTDANNKDHYFLIFVCPTVTVVSPDGAVYTHQKVYNQKMKVFFSESKYFDINCVLAQYDGKIYDITADIDEHTGRYESKTPIQNDVRYTVTLRENHKEQLISDNKMRLGVMNGEMKLIPSDSKNPLNTERLSNMRVVATTVKNISQYGEAELVEQEVFSSKGSDCINFNEDGIHDLNITFNDGIYYIKFYEGNELVDNYKIVINREV